VAPALLIHARHTTEVATLRLRDVAKVDVAVENDGDSVKLLLRTMRSWGPCVQLSNNEPGTMVCMRLLASLRSQLFCEISLIPLVANLVPFRGSTVSDSMMQAVQDFLEP
jgi:hypothetical protein